MALEPADAATRGELIAAVLAGAWRCEPPPLELTSSDLEAITPLLVRLGSGALAWWRLRNGAYRDTAAGRGLRQAYRRHTIDAEIHRRRGVELLTRLSAAGVEPLLVKGWAIARLYPEVALRQYADLDLIVPSSQMPAATSCLADSSIPRDGVDLHDGPGKLDPVDFDDLASRAVSVPVGELTVRVPSLEDHLRILAVHALRHGMVRPLWLADLAIAVESRSADFDWQRCLGPDRRRREYVVAAIGLAHQLLGADLTGTPIPAGPGAVPAWLSSAVLRAWGRAAGQLCERPPAFRALISCLGDRRRLREEWLLRWDKPIQATIEQAGPLSGMPRFPFQLASAFRRLPELTSTVRTMAHERWRRRAGASSSRDRDTA